MILLTFNIKDIIIQYCAFNIPVGDQAVVASTLGEEPSAPHLTEAVVKGFKILPFWNVIKIL